MLLVIALNKVRATGAFHRAAKRDVRRTSGGRGVRPGDRVGAGPGRDRAERPPHGRSRSSWRDLPEAHRRMIELRIEGHEVAEIAETVQRSKRSVERVLQDFRQRLDALIQTRTVDMVGPVNGQPLARASTSSSRRTSRPWPATAAPTSPTSPPAPTTPSGSRSSASWSGWTWNTSWRRGQPRRLEHYRDRFPDLFVDPELVHAMAFEEYRLRLQAGERPTPADYRRRFGLEGATGRRRPPDRPRTGPSRTLAPPSLAATARHGGAGRQRLPGMPAAAAPGRAPPCVPAEQAELLRDLDRTDPHTAERLADALAGLPPVGGRFLGLPALRRAGPGGVRPRLPRPPGRPGRPARGPEGLGRRGGRDARPGAVAAHQHRPDLLGPPPRAAPGGLHAVPRRDHPGRHARRPEEPGRRCPTRARACSAPCTPARTAVPGPASRPAATGAVGRPATPRRRATPAPRREPAARPDARRSSGSAGWVTSRPCSGWSRGWPTGWPTPTSGASSTAT